MKIHLSRFREIQRVRALLEREGYPRLQMLLLVMLTGGVGFIGSSLLLRAGLGEMWLRYLLALAVAYLAFLFLLWLWLRTRADDYVDFIDPSGFTPSSNSGGGHEYHHGHGGEFGGGGASGSFDGAGDGVQISDNQGLAGEAVGAAAEAEEFAIPLIVIIFVATLLCSSLFMIYSAPMLFAELFVDGVLSASLYRKLRGLETQHWLETAIKRTVWPFVGTAIIVAAFGWGMSLYAPGADSIGDVIIHFNHAGGQESAD